MKKLQRIEKDSKTCNEQYRHLRAIYALLGSGNDQKTIPQRWCKMVNKAQSFDANHPDAKITQLKKLGVVGTRKVVVCSRFRNPLRDLKRTWPESTLIESTLNATAREQAFNTFIKRKCGLLLLPKSITHPAHWRLPTHTLMIFWEVSLTDAQDLKLVNHLHLKPAHTIQFMSPYMDAYLWKRRGRKRRTRDIRQDRPTSSLPRGKKRQKIAITDGHRKVIQLLQQHA